MTTLYDIKWQESSRIQHLLTTTVLSINSSLSSSCIHMSIISFQMHLVLLILVGNPKGQVTLWIFSFHYISIWQHILYLQSIYLAFCLLWRRWWNISGGINQILRSNKQTSSSYYYDSFLNRLMWIAPPDINYLKLRESIINVSSVRIDSDKKSNQI